MYRSLFCILLTLCLMTVAAHADVPSSITVQGRLTDSLNIPPPAGVKGFTFRIFNAPSGGTEIWSGEDQFIATDANGLWVAQVGAIVGLNDAVFADTTRWLQVSIDNVHLPRVRLVTGPYAHRVSTVDGASGGIITSKLAIGSGHLNVGFESFVAGFDNNVDGDYTSVTGGQSNAANGQFSHIGGGQNDTANGDHSAIAGGLGNHTQGLGTFVGAGVGNRSTAEGSAIAGGGSNRASGTYSFVGGGGGATPDSNSASGPWSSVVGGSHNVASGLTSFVGGGSGNIAKSGSAAIVGGTNNRADTSSNFIGGGRDNHTDQVDAVIGGGWMNEALGNTASILGGRGNVATGVSAVVGGGNHNRARGNFSFVGGGGNQPADSNAAIGNWSTVGGGHSNLAQGDMAAVGGGERNEAALTYAVVAGGFNNEANGSQSFIGGGRDNQTGDSGAVVVGGGRNVARGKFSFVGGGGSIDGADSNAAHGYQSVVVGGHRNLASSQQTFVGGGEDNRASQPYAVVTGGNNNAATAIYAVVSGGLSNAALGGAATVPGGSSDTASGLFSLAAGFRAKAGHAGTFVWADSTNAQFASTAQDQFLIRAGGGVGIGTNLPEAPLHVFEGSAGAVTASSSSGAVLERNANNYLSILAPDGSEKGILFGDPSSNINGSILFDDVASPDGMQFHVNNDLNSMTITSAADVGIGTTNPEARLHVFLTNVVGAPANGNSIAVLERGAGGWLSMISEDNSERGLLFTEPSLDVAGAIVFDQGGGGNDLGFRTGGNVTNMTLDATGNLTVVGCVDGNNTACASDRRFKKDIETLQDPLTTVQRLRGVTFRWRQDEFPLRHFENGEQMGLIAQEVQEVLPGAVREREDGYLSVEYNELIPLLLEAMKEQQRQIDELKSTIRRMQP